MTLAYKRTVCLACSEPAILFEDGLLICVSCEYQTFFHVEDVPPDPQERI